MFSNLDFQSSGRIINKHVEVPGLRLWFSFSGREMVPLLLWGLWNSQCCGNSVYHWLTHILQDELNFLGCTCKRAESLACYSWLCLNSIWPSMASGNAQGFHYQDQNQNQDGEQWKQNQGCSTSHPPRSCWPGIASEFCQSYLLPLSIPPGPGKLCSSLHRSPESLGSTNWPKLTEFKQFLCEKCLLNLKFLTTQNLLRALISFQHISQKAPSSLAAWRYFYSAAE